MENTIHKVHCTCASCAVERFANQLAARLEDDAASYDRVIAWSREMKVFGLSWLWWPLRSYATSRASSLRDCVRLVREAATQHTASSIDRARNRASDLAAKAGITEHEYNCLRCDRMLTNNERVVNQHRPGLCTVCHTTRCLQCGKTLFDHERARGQSCSGCRAKSQATSPPCWCSACEDARLAHLSLGEQMQHRRFIVCPDCGNKRCPRATNHELACTSSNEPGQPGSAYE